VVSGVTCGCSGMRRCGQRIQSCTPGGRAQDFAFISGAASVSLQCGVSPLRSGVPPNSVAGHMDCVGLILRGDVAQPQRPSAIPRLRARLGDFSASSASSRHVVWGPFARSSPGARAGLGDPSGCDGDRAGFGHGAAMPRRARRRSRAPPRPDSMAAPTDSSLAMSSPPNSGGEAKKGLTDHRHKL